MFTDENIRMLNLAAMAVSELRRTGLTADQYYDQYLTPRKSGWRVRPLDSDGWVIPRPRTKARKIYDLAKCGCTTSEIAGGARVNPCYVEQTLTRLRKDSQT